MGWSAWMSNSTPPDCGYWNYTHNCNRMMSTALEDVGAELENHWLIGHLGKSWFKAINGRDGQVGAEVLGTILAAFKKDPDRFRAMNPENGWGDFDSIWRILAEMHIASLAAPTAVWHVCG